MVSTSRGLIDLRLMTSTEIPSAAKVSAALRASPTILDMVSTKKLNGEMKYHVSLFKIKQ